MGTFYAYFKNKGDLFAYSFKKKPDATFAEFLKTNITGTTVLDRIISFFRYYAWLNIGTNPDELKKMYMPAGGFFNTNPPIFYDVLHKIITDGQADGEITLSIHSEMIVDMIKTYLRGCCYEWMMEERAFDIEERIITYVGQLAKSFIVNK